MKNQARAQKQAKYLQCTTFLLVRDDINESFQVDVGREVYVHAAVLQDSDVATAGALQVQRAPRLLARRHPLRSLAPLKHLPQTAGAERVGTVEHLGLSQKVQAYGAYQLLANPLHLPTSECS